MADAFAQAGTWCSGRPHPEAVSGSDAMWPWLIGLLHHDSLASFAAYHAGVSALASRHDGNGLRSRMAGISAAANIATLARECAPLSGLHPVLRRGDIAVHTDNLFTRGFLPIPAERMAVAVQSFFGFRQAGLHAINAAARVASYLILLTLHPYRDGNGRTARLLFAADTWTAAAPPLDLLGLAWLHGQRNARFHLAAKCARAGDFDMLFALYAESWGQAWQILGVSLRALDAALRSGDTAAIAAAARALHAAVSLHVRQG